MLTRPLEMVFNSMLNTGFILYSNEYLYVPSNSRNFHRYYTHAWARILKTTITLWQNLEPYAGFAVEPYKIQVILDILVMSALTQNLSWRPVAKVNFFDKQL